MHGVKMLKCVHVTQMKLRIRAKAHGDGSRLEVEKLGQASEGCHKEENQIV